MGFLFLYELKSDSKKFQFHIPPEVPINYNVVDNLIILNFFVPIISFILDFEPVNGF